MVPGEILEDIFAYLSRDDLDYCEISCLKWRNVIETSKRLTQRRVVNLRYRGVDDDDPSFWVKLTTQTTFKTIRIEDDPTRQELPASRVFKNIIIDELIEFDRHGIDFFEEAWEKIFKLAGDRIIVKSVDLRFDEGIQHDNFSIFQKRFHDLLPKYIDAAGVEIYVKAFYRESFKTLSENLDFGKKTEMTIYIDIYESLGDDSFNAFKEFISGKYMEHPNLNYLCIRDWHDTFHSPHLIINAIMEAFCFTDEPQKFFKIIIMHELYAILFDRSLFENVRDFKLDNPAHNKYLLNHPKLKWALEFEFNDDAHHHVESGIMDSRLYTKFIERELTAKEKLELVKKSDLNMTKELMGIDSDDDEGLSLYKLKTAKEKLELVKKSDLNMTKELMGIDSEGLSFDKLKTQSEFEEYADNLAEKLNVQLNNKQ